jgi:hypothetical protein
VAAWVLGLAVAPSAPSPDASNATINAFYADHQSATLLQAALVHCIAGLALAGFVLSLAGGPGAAHGDSRRTVVLAAGLAAAAVSLVQFVMEVVLNRHVAGDGSAATTASLFHAINVADMVKLFLLGIAVFAATRLLAGRRLLPRWLQILGYVLLPVLVIGGAAFVVSSDALNAVLTASLLLLLLWVAAVTIAVTRRSPESSPADAPSS